MSKANGFKGIVYAILSSATFGLSPFFSISLLGMGLSYFEVLFYRWGVAALALGMVAVATGHSLRLGRRDAAPLCLLGLLRAVTSFSLVVAYGNIATGVASSIHFIYPLAVACGMALFFKEKLSWQVLLAIALSLIGAVLLSWGDIGAVDGNRIVGMAAACVSVLSYGGYIIGVRKSRISHMDSAALTFYVMAFGAVLFGVGSVTTTGGITLVTDGRAWLYILGLSLVATAISNFTLVQAIKHIGPTLSSLFGAMEPLTAMIIGVSVLGERFTLGTAVGVALVIIAVSIVVVREGRQTTAEMSGVQSASGTDADA